MVNNISFFKKYKFLAIFLLLFLAEGLGLPNGRTIAFYLILLIPFFIFWHNFKDKEVYIPKNIAILFSAFFVVSCASVVFSQNTQRSFEFLLIYASLSMIFVFSYNHKEKLSKLIVPLILILSFIYSVYSILIRISTSDAGTSHLIPPDGYQLVFTSFGHNHLGNFLMLAIVACLFMLINYKNKLIPLLCLIFYLPFFLFSYARSAYLDLTLIIIFMIAYIIRSKQHTSKLLVVSLTVVLAVCVLFFFSTTIDFKFQATDTIQNVLSSKYELKNKYFTGQREKHLAESLSAILLWPILGVGPGNYYIASEKFTTQTPLTGTAHNIFLDFLVENGLFAGATFLLIIFIVFKKAKFNLLLLLAIALLLNFQTDYTYRILSISVLFSILIGLIYNDKNDIKISKFVQIFPSLLFACGILIFISNIIVIEKPKLALYLFPLNETAYLTLLEKNPTNPDLIRIYTKLFSDSAANEFAGKQYKLQGENIKALEYFNKAYDQKRLKDTETIKNLYQQIYIVKGKDEANKFIEDLFTKVSNKKILIHPYSIDDLNRFCMSLDSTVAIKCQ